MWLVRVGQVRQEVPMAMETQGSQMGTEAQVVELTSSRAAVRQAAEAAEAIQVRMLWTLACFLLLLRSSAAAEQAVARWPQVEQAAMDTSFSVSHPSNPFVVVLFETQPPLLQTLFYIQSSP